MIIRNDFMNNNDGNNNPVIPGIRTPFDYINEQTKINGVQKKQVQNENRVASAENLKQLENQNAINHLKQPFMRK